MAKWRPCRAPAPLLVRAALTANLKSDVDALATDLIAALDEDELAVSEAAPAWLKRVVEALWDGDNPTAAEAAGIAGVHRVHLSRAFARHVGVPFSAYRRRVAAARAIEATLRTTDRFVDIAVDSGFADQAHMNRTFVEVAGTSPGLLREQIGAPVSPSRGHNGRRPT